MSTVSTTADLIEAIKAQETIPDSGSAYGDSTLLLFLNNALLQVAGLIEVTNEEYFVVTRDFALTGQMMNINGVPTNVDNVIQIPAISSGMRLRDVYMVGPQGGFTNLPRLSPTQAASATNGFYNGGMGNGMAGFYLQGNTIQIFPYGLAQGHTFRITFQRSPADLCLIGDAGQVLSKTGDVLSISAVPNWTAGLTRVAVISGAQPHDYVSNATIPTAVYCSPAPLDNVLVSSIAGNVVTLPAGVAANVQVGDWICPAGQSVFAQNIPRELYPALVQRAAAACLEAAGDRDGQVAALKTFQEMMQVAMTQLAPRVIGKPKVINQRNSIFKASRTRVWGR